MMSEFSTKLKIIYDERKNSKKQPKYLKTIKEILDLDKQIKGD